ncbi:hypothetical protein [Halosimplex amylolyticum]|uniref:hypothetical protein n=1 Tax=Halosimplex amylolyticum TaxID=3396616 RepID=UPI003F55044D
MPDEPVETHLLVERFPEIRDTLEGCLSAGFSSSTATGSTAWSVVTDGDTSDNLSTEAAISALESAEWGWIEGWFDELPVRIGFCLERRFVPANSRTVSVGTSELYLQPDAPDAAENLASYLELVGLLYNYTDTWYGFGSFLSSGVGSEALEPDIGSLRDGVVTELYWLNIYTPAFVEWFGRSNLSSAPAARTEQLSDGGFLLLSTMFPYEFGTLSDRSTAVADHLGLEISS